MALVLLVAGAAFGQKKLSDKQVAAELRKQYARAARAFKAKDLAGLTAVLAPDFTSTDSDGRTEDREAAVSAFKARMDSTQSIQKMAWTIQNIGLKPEEATVAALLEIHSRAPDPAKKRTHKLALRAESVDTWVQLDGEWMLRHVQAGKSETFLDGKPYGPTPASPPRAKRRR